MVSSGRALCPEQRQRKPFVVRIKHVDLLSDSGCQEHMLKQKTGLPNVFHPVVWVIVLLHFSDFVELAFWSQLPSYLFVFDKRYEILSESSCVIKPK